jgi:hypothetical protein
MRRIFLLYEKFASESSYRLSKCAPTGLAAEFLDQKRDLSCRRAGAGPSAETLHIFAERRDRDSPAIKGPKFCKISRFSAGF